MAARIVEQIADQPAQQPGVAVERDRLTGQHALLVVGAFFRREPEQIERLDLQGRRGVEPAGQQYLIDQQVELGDVAREIGRELVVLPALCVELEAEPQPRQWGAQLVRRIGEQHAVGADQFLDAAGGAVEARRQPRHLVAAFDLDPCREVAGAQRLDAGLETLEPPRQAAHHWIGRDGDRQRNAAQEQHEADGRMAWRIGARATIQRPSGRWSSTPGRRAHRASRRSGSLRRRRQRPAVVRDRHARVVEQRGSILNCRARRRTARSWDSGGADGGGSAAAASWPAMSNAWAIGMRSPPNRHTAPATSTTSSKLAMMVR